MQTCREQSCVDGQVDRVARSADRAEADELILEQAVRCADCHLLTVAGVRRLYVGRTGGRVQPKDGSPSLARV
jgi:hypothetical protein